MPCRVISRQGAGLALAATRRENVVFHYYPLPHYPSAPANSILSGLDMAEDDRE